MSTTRAKFRCMEQRTSFGQPGSKYVFSAVYDDGIEENARFSQYTPAATLEMLVDNANVSFTVGGYYYLDITEVAE